MEQIEDQLTITTLVHHCDQPAKAKIILWSLEIQKFWDQFDMLHNGKKFVTLYVNEVQC